MVTAVVVIIALFIPLVVLPPWLHWLDAGAFFVLNAVVRTGLDSHDCVCGWIVVLAANNCAASLK